MIDCARRKSDALGAPATWIRCDLLDTPHELDGTADLVYTGRGALNWLMDIDAWAQVVARLLKPGSGRLFVFEGHPISSIWDRKPPSCGSTPTRCFGDYFATTPVVDQGWPVQYIPAEAVPPKEEQSPKYERHWTLGEILTRRLAPGWYLSDWRYQTNTGSVPQPAKIRSPIGCRHLLAADAQGAASL